jgi:hypothetical protein
MEVAMAKQSDEGWRQHVIDNVLPRMEANDMGAATGFTPAPANPQPFSAGMHLQPQFDVIELLPPIAADKLRKLRLRKDDAHRLIPEFESVRSASLAKIDAANALKHLTDHPQYGGKNLPPMAHPASPMPRSARAFAAWRSSMETERTRGDANLRFSIASTKPASPLSNFGSGPS